MRLNNFTVDRLRKILDAKAPFLLLSKQRVGLRCTRHAYEYDTWNRQNAETTHSFYLVSGKCGRIH